MNSALDNYRLRRQLLERAARRPHLIALPATEHARALVTAPEDRDYVDAASIAQTFALPDDHDIARGGRTLLDQLYADFDRGRLDHAIDGLQRTITHNVADAFGIGALLAADDQKGGDVDTINNARQGIYGSEAERERYANRGACNSKAVYQDQAYIDANRAMATALDQGTLVDTYTGKPIKLAQKNDWQLKGSLDHPVPIASVHDDAGRVLAGLATPAVANVPENFAPTTVTTNSSMKHRSAPEYVATLEREAPARRDRMQVLEGKRANWSDAERREYTKLREQEDTVAANVIDAQHQARTSMDRLINKTYYTSGKFAWATATAAANAGMKMGVQQALGVVLAEFFDAVLVEVRDLYRHGITEASFAKDVTIRLRRVARRVAGSWRGALAGLRDGFLSGLLSSLATTLINAFFTTGKRLVRIIREGFASFMRAGRLLVQRQDMTWYEALHEASKVLAGGAAVLGGIATEEALAAQLALVPGLGMVAGAATAAIVGAATAIVTTLAVYTLDKIDLFGVNAAARLDAADVALDKLLAAPSTT